MSPQELHWKETILSNPEVEVAEEKRVHVSSTLYRKKLLRRVAIAEIPVVAAAGFSDQIR